MEIKSGCVVDAPVCQRRGRGGLIRVYLRSKLANAKASCKESFDNAKCQLYSPSTSSSALFECIFYAKHLFHPP